MLATIIFTSTVIAILLASFTFQTCMFAPGRLDNTSKRSELCVVDTKSVVDACLLFVYDGIDLQGCMSDSTCMTAQAAQRARRTHS